MLARMFSDEERRESGDAGVLPSLRDDDGAYLLDSDPENFRPVLNYLRSGVLVLGKADPMGVYEAASYFQVQPILKMLDPSGSLSERRASSLSNASDVNADIDYDQSRVVMLCLFSGIVYVTGVTLESDKIVLRRPAWVAGVDVFRPGGTSSMPCYQLQSKSGSANRGHLLELISNLVHNGWTIATSSHDQKAGDIYTLTR
jgi:BTB/POZ domain